MTMRYQIERTAKADEQLRDIILYRAGVRSSIDAALELLDEMEMEINQLSDFPECGAPPRYAALRARGYRVLIVAKKYLVFYKVNLERNTVIVHAVVDGRQDYLNLI